MHFAPIVLFVYKRFTSTKLTVESLRKNSEAVNSDLIIFSDGAKSEKDINLVDDVRKYINSITGFKTVTVFKNEKNLGLANSIINGVTRVVNQYGKIIVLEDDMIISPYFLKYMNEALTLYENEDKVVSVHGYIYPVNEKLPETFFLRGADCWGWATWKRGWDIFEPDSEKLLQEIHNRKLEYEFDLNGTFNNVRMLKNQIEGRVDSWAIRWHASAFIKNKYTLYPGSPLVKNIGMDEQATHTKKMNVYDVVIKDTPITVIKIPVEENVQARKIVEKFFFRANPNFISRLVKLFKYKF
ncbi:MAG: glycosyltransferase [Ignavibacteriaceae bacterium]